MANLARTETLIGRSDDVRALALAVTQSRLVTLLGPGGVGKTRLAVELAAELETEYEQVQFIDLTTATADPLIGDLNGQAATSAYEALDAASALIVFDNCEHLVDDAAAWIGELLTSTRRVVVIATSRRPLHLSSEQIYPVRPLSVPLGESDVEKLVAYETVQLFVERAVQAEPSFNLLEANALQVARICELSEGLPIVVELAASLTRSRPLEGVVAAMEAGVNAEIELQRRDVHPHQQTLGRSIDWSLRLLSDDELHLMECAASFVGGFSAEALVDVHNVASGRDTLVLLDELVGHSLVTLDRDAARYYMLDLVADAVRAGIHEDARVTLNDAHSAWALDQVRRIAAQLTEPDPDDQFKLFMDDIPNIGVAMSWLEQTDRPDDWLALVGPIGTWWTHHGPPIDVERWLAAASGAQTSRDTITLRLGLAYYFGHAGQHDESEYHARQALEQATEFGYGDLAVQAHRIVGDAYLSRGDRASASSSYQDALDSEGSYPFLDAVALVSLARVTTDQNTARAHLNSVVALSSGRYPALLVVVQQNLARLELSAGNTVRAAELAVASGAMAEAIGYEEAMGTAHNTFGAIAMQTGEADEAEVDYRQAVAIGQRIGHSGVVADGLVGLGEVCLDAGQDDVAALLAGRAVSLAVDLELGPALGALLSNRGSAPDMAPNTDRSTSELLALIAERPEPRPIPHREALDESLLTERELSVLRLLRGDLTQREIADEMYISPSTVRTHVKSLYRKLGVHNRTGCVHKATMLGYLGAP